MSSAAEQYATKRNAGGKMQKEDMIENNACLMKFILQDKNLPLHQQYDTTTTKVIAGKFSPSKKFLNEIADTFATDLIAYIKGGGSEKSVSARQVYAENI